MNDFVKPTPLLIWSGDREILRLDHDGKLTLALADADEAAARLVKMVAQGCAMVGFGDPFEMLSALRKIMEGNSTLMALADDAGRAGWGMRLFAFDEILSEFQAVQTKRMNAPAFTKED